MDNYIIREYEPGEPSLVSHFYFKLFEKQYQFKPATEKYFMKSMSEIFDDPEGNQLWIVEQENKIVGSIAVMKRGENAAQLRMFGMDTSLQGKGIGNQLMTLAMNFCKDKGYTYLNLWTIDMLHSAKHLYAKFGFKPNDSKENTEWADYPMLEEEWIFEDKNN